jgi:hypothetical protein
MPLVREDEFRHFPFEADRQQPEGKADREGQRGRKIVVQPGPKCCDIDRAGDRRDAGIKLRTKQQRGFPGEQDEKAGGFQLGSGNCRPFRLLSDGRQRRT